MPDQIDWARALISEGATRAGRSIESIELWWYAKASLGDSMSDAVSMARAGLASTAALTLGQDPVGTGVPEHLHGALVEIHRNYDVSAHAGSSDRNDQLLTDPEVIGYVMDRFGLLGTADDWVQRLRQLESRGVDRVFCAAVVPNRAEMIERIGREVLPQLGGG